jgi:hypothetical protein
MAQRLAALFRDTEKNVMYVPSHNSLAEQVSQVRNQALQSLRTLVGVNNKEVNNGLIENKFLQALIPHFNKPLTNPKPGAPPETAEAYYSGEYFNNLIWVFPYYCYC